MENDHEGRMMLVRLLDAFGEWCGLLGVDINECSFDYALETITNSIIWARENRPEPEASEMEESSPI